MPHDTYIDVLDDALDQAMDVLRIVAAALRRAPLNDEVGDYINQYNLDALFDQALAPAVGLLAAAAHYADRERMKRALDGGVQDASKRALMAQSRESGNRMLSIARERLLKSVSEGAA